MREILTGVLQRDAPVCWETVGLVDGLVRELDADRGRGVELPFRHVQPPGVTVCRPRSRQVKLPRDRQVP